MSANGDARTASPDRATMMVAMVALLLSGVATYAEFIHNPTSFTANVRGLRIGHVEDTTLAIQDALTVALDRRERGAYDVRPIALARSDLRDRVEAGSLRRDLWFSLASVRVQVPPLRHQRSQISRPVRHHKTQIPIQFLGDTA